MSTGSVANLVLSSLKACSALVDQEKVLFVENGYGGSGLAIVLDKTIKVGKAQEALQLFTCLGDWTIQDYLHFLWNCLYLPALKDETLEVTQDE